MCVCEHDEDFRERYLQGLGVYKRLWRFGDAMQGLKAREVSMAEIFPDFEMDICRRGSVDDFSRFWTFLQIV